MTSRLLQTAGRRLRAYVAILAALACLGAGESAPPAVKLVVNPKVTTGPATVTFTVTIEPNKNNRKACLAYDGPEAGLSCWQVDGDQHPRTDWLRRRVGGDGEYFATLTLVSVVCDAQNNCSVKHQTAVATFTLVDPGVPTVR